MSYKTYEVRVFDGGNKFWYLNGKRHREDGPAIECVNGHKEWWLNHERLSEEEFNECMREKNNTCEGKLVEIDGKQYKLTEV